MKYYKISESTLRLMENFVERNNRSLHAGTIAMYISKAKKGIDNVHIILDEDEAANLKEEIEQLRRDFRTGFEIIERHLKNPAPVRLKTFRRSCETNHVFSEKPRRHGKSITRKELKRYQKELAEQHGLKFYEDRPLPEPEADGFISFEMDPPKITLFNNGGEDVGFSFNNDISDYLVSMAITPVPVTVGPNHKYYDKLRVLATNKE